MKIDALIGPMINTIKSINTLVILALVLIGATVSPLAWAQEREEPVVKPSGPERAATVADLRPHPVIGSRYNEVWSYTFLFDGGMNATLTLSLAHLGGILGSVSGGELSLSGFDGRTYRVPKQYEAEDLTFSEDRQRLAVGPKIYFEGALPQQHRVHFEGGKNGNDFELDLAFSDIARGLTQGDGIFRLGDERIGMFIHIPYARVAGTVRVNGTTKSVRGTAYMDHSFQTTFATKLVRQAYRFVQHGRQAEVGYVVMPSDRYQNCPVGLVAVREGGRFRLRTPSKVQVVSTRKALGSDIPHQLAVRYDAGDPTILNREGEYQAFSSLEDLASLQRAVVKSYLGGEAFVFRGRGLTNRRHPVVYDYLVVR